jgi:endonuclease G, mitochondrial
MLISHNNLTVKYGSFPYLSGMGQRILLLLFAIAVQHSFAQTDVDQKIKQKQDSIAYFQNKIKAVESSMEDLKLSRLRNDLKTNGLPKLQANEILIEHLAMSLVYDESHEVAKWVAHIITADVVNGNEGRTNDFRPDPLVKTGSADETDYFTKTKDGKGYKYEGYGYDRGHLAPSADFRWSQKALSESYLYSNMTPQVADFNRISWAKLEDMMRNYIVRNPGTQLYMVTGPVLTQDLPKVPKAINKLSIPKWHYKIALDLKNKRAVAFLMENKKAEAPLETYSTTIDEIEKITGIDFFASLTDSIENRLEAKKDIKAFQGMAEQDDVEPIDATSLPRNTFNTTQAQIYMGKGERVTVCGTVVSTKLSSKGNIFINLDKQFPNQVFSISIFKDKTVNFTYKPEEFLKGKKICVTGIITKYNGTPTMNIENEKAIKVTDEED